MIYSKFEWNWSAGSGEKILKKIIPGFFPFRYYLPLEKGDPLHLNRIESTSPKDDLCQIWLKLVQWFWRRFLNDPTPFLHFCDYHHFEEDLAFSLFEQSWIPFTQGWFVPSLIEFGPVVLKIFFFKFQCFLLFRYHLPLGKGDPLHLHKFELSSPKDDLYQVWLKLAQWFRRRSGKCKCLQTDGQRAIRIAHLSFQLRWAKNR